MYKYVTSFWAYELWSSPTVPPFPRPVQFTFCYLNVILVASFIRRAQFIESKFSIVRVKKSRLIIDRANQVLSIFSIVYISCTIIVSFSILLISSWECTWLAIIEHPLSTWSIVFSRNNFGELCTTSWRYCRPSIRSNGDCEGVEKEARSSRARDAWSRDLCCESIRVSSSRLPTKLHCLYSRCQDLITESWNKYQSLQTVACLFYSSFFANIFFFYIWKKQNAILTRSNAMNSIHEKKKKIITT